MTVAGRTDEELAVSAQHGCTESCEELLTRVRPSLVRYLELRTGRLDLAEDLTQETLLRAVQKLHLYKAQHKVRSWLFTIARRIGVRRSLRPWRTHDGPGEVWLTAQGRPEDSLIADELAHRFWCQLAIRMPLDDLISLWLVHTDRLSLAHVGRLLGLAPSTVKMRLFRARRKLRQQLQHRSECR